MIGTTILFVCLCVMRIQNAFHSEPAWNRTDLEAARNAVRTGNTTEIERTFHRLAVKPIFDSPTYLEFFYRCIAHSPPVIGVGILKAEDWYWQKVEADLDWWQRGLCGPGMRGYLGRPDVFCRLILWVRGIK